MTRLLDPRFRYVPAAATDVTQTWKRFGFNAHVNEIRRAEQFSKLLDVPASEAAAFAELISGVAAARMAT